MMINSGKRFI